MNDLDKRRAFNALKLISKTGSMDGLPIVIDGETYRCEWTSVGNGTHVRDAVGYHDSEGQWWHAWFRDVSFDFAVLTTDQQAIIERYEQERLRDFAGKLRKKLQSYMFDAFWEADGNRHALDRCRTLELGQNLFIHGPPGNGKTMLATATAREASRYYSAAVWSTVELFTVIRNSFSRDAKKERPDLERVEFLVLDDLDKVRATDFVYEELYTLINNRYENELTTIFTSNHRPRETALKVSGDPDNAYALMSRIASGDVVEVAGNDARVLQGREVLKQVA